MKPTTIYTLQSIWFAVSFCRISEVSRIYHPLKLDESVTKIHISEEIHRNVSILGTAANRCRLHKDTSSRAENHCRDPKDWRICKTTIGRKEFTNIIYNAKQRSEDSSRLAKGSLPRIAVLDTRQSQELQQTIWETLSQIIPPSFASSQFVFGNSSKGNCLEADSIQTKVLEF